MLLCCQQKSCRLANRDEKEQERFETKLTVKSCIPEAMLLRKL